MTTMTADHKAQPKAGSDHISYATDTPSVAARCDECGQVIYLSLRLNVWRHKARKSWEVSA